MSGVREGRIERKVSGGRVRHDSRLPRDAQLLRNEAKKSFGINLFPIWCNRVSRNLHLRAHNRATTLDRELRHLLLERLRERRTLTRVAEPPRSQHYARTHYDCYL